MTHDLQIFLSGHHTRGSDLAALKKHLSDPATIAALGEVYFDSISAYWYADATPPQATVLGTFERMRGCDVLVFWLSDKSLDTPLVREEIGYAYYSGLRVLALLHAEEHNREECLNSLGKSFHFSKHIDVVKWEGPDTSEAARAIVRHIRHLASFGFQALSHELTRAARSFSGLQFLSLQPHIQANTYLPGQPLYRLRLAHRIIEKTAEELRMVFGGHYHLNLSLEENFLQRAGDIFSSAKEVFAVSRDDVSHFWTDPASRDSALDYVARQCKSTHRLFVFDTPDRAHHHAEVLDAHVDLYGDLGSVFVCSLSDFKRLLRHCGLADRVDQREDFGLLEMTLPDRPSTTVHAELNTKFLKFYDLNAERKRFVRFMDVLRAARVQTQGGYVAARESVLRSTRAPQVEALLSTLSAASRPTEEPVRLYRWASRLWHAQSDGWAKALQVLFGRLLEEDNQHLLLVSPSLETSVNVLDTLRAVREEIVRALATLNIDGQVWMGTRMPSDEVRDRSYKGRIRLDADGGRFAHLLLMTFHSSADRDKWYSWLPHSDLRRRLYCAIDSGLGAKYGQLDALERQAQPGFFEENIEAIAARYIWRLDFREDQAFRVIVSRDPFAFDVGRLRSDG